MIRFLFLIIIAAIVLVFAFYRFKSVPLVKKMTIAGGGLAAAAVGVLLQEDFAWYFPILAIVAVSLIAALVYMKLDEREKLEKQRLAEERKERRKELIKPDVRKAEKVGSVSSVNNITIAKNEELDEEVEGLNARETIIEPEKVIVRETIQAPEFNSEREAVNVREKLKVPDDEKMPEKPYGMQSIQPVGKEG